MHANQWSTMTRYESDTGSCCSSRDLQLFPSELAGVCSLLGVRSDQVDKVCRLEGLCARVMYALTLPTSVRDARMRSITCNENTPCRGKARAFERGLPVNFRIVR